MHRFLTAALFLMSLSIGVNVHADRDDDMEPWQKRILEALEAADEPADRRNQYSREKAEDEGASEAAKKARRTHGGKVLAVVPHKGGYRVRLLLDDGRVKTVRIED